MSTARLFTRRWLVGRQGVPWPWLIVPAVLLLAARLGGQASPRILMLVVIAPAVLLLLRRPPLGLAALIIVALLGGVEIGTGSEVKLNAATLLVPALLGVWLLHMMRRRRLYVAPSRANLPLLLFLAASLLSLLVGRATWDPMIPLKGNFLMVQLAQWTIFAFSALAFWLTANLPEDERWLQRLTAVFLLVGGGLAILRLLPGLAGLVGPLITLALDRPPFWVLLTALAGGQLLFNRALSLAWRAFLVAVILTALVYAFVQQRDSTSNWVGVGAVLAVLTWFRFRRLRWPILLTVAVLIGIGVLFPAVYNFAGGDQGWTSSGAPRLVLIERVIDVTMRNPITGLGPAAYRPYANATPLRYRTAYWVQPNVNSHNNYVDLFAHGGLIGLGLFLWFVIEIAVLGLRLRRRHQEGFRAGYVNGILAAGIGALAIMMLADWILPFVYNIGFPGFQASVLVWLFMGGLVALDRMGDTEISSRSRYGTRRNGDIMLAHVQHGETGRPGSVG